MTYSSDIIGPDLIEQAMSYESYRRLIQELLQQGKTTGDNHSQEFLDYTRLNVQRMKRLDKTVILNNKIQQILSGVDGPWIWLVLTEAWCGDAAQNIPLLQAMAETSEHIALRLILRDEHLDVMDEYLTDGGRSIPKLICLDKESLKEIGTWGPRPVNLQQKAMAWKGDADITKKEWVEKLHHWYHNDKGRSIQRDFVKLVPKWNS